MDDDGAAALFDELYPPERCHDKEVMREVLSILADKTRGAEEQEVAKRVGECWVMLNRGAIPEAEELFDPPDRLPRIVHNEGGLIELQ